MFFKILILMGLSKKRKSEATKDALNQEIEIAKKAHEKAEVDLKNLQN
jgi:hypothetical protein